MAKVQIKKKVLKEVIDYLELLNKRIGDEEDNLLTEYDWREISGLLLNLKKVK